MAERPTKRAKFLSDSESDGSDNEGVKLPKKTAKKAEFKINDEYAKRFEHNNKRADLQRLEEKYGKGGSEEESEESSTDESEDDDAELITADLDEEIFATLNAIKNKDPRVYDEKVKFYKEFDPEDIAKGEKKEKAMTLQDYHRQNLLSGYTGEEEEKDAPQTYNQEQDALRRQVVGQMHAMADGDDDSEDDFKPKAKGAHDSLPAAKTKKAKKLTEEDIKAADKDPETYLSNFMAAQAWRPTEGSGPHAFDSDDSEDDARADAFEEAYNMRFEDPALANEKLQTFARDVGKYSVRREEVKGRKSAREKERERREAERREREEDRARLRRLKIEEAEEKVKKIKEAAGLRGKDVDISQWQDVIEGDFNDSQWDKEMERRFGAEYYAVPEGEEDSDVEMAEDGKKKHKVKKPKWDDDIDIKDLIPEFEDEEEARKYALSSDDEEEGGAPLNGSDDEEEGTGEKRKTKKDRLKEKAEAKRASRKERRAIEEMVDANLPITHAPVTGFRYRETSPTSFGLSARDILFADDAALNQFAGLKKMATWRDPERKAKEAKKLSKKGRLRQWRKDTFGKPDAPEGGFEVILGASEGTGANAAEPKAKNGEDGNVKEGDRKKKRSKKRKAKEVEA